jgi:hypothetical protein
MNKKLFVIITLLLLITPVKGTFSQDIEEPRRQFREQISWENELNTPSAPTVPGQFGGGQGPYYTHPEFNDVMTATVTIPAQNTAEGYIFIAPLATGNYNGPPAIMILEDSGEPIYINTFGSNPFVGDFKKQTVNGVDYLTYHTGVQPGGYTYGASYVMDESYEIIDTWTLGNGTGSDVHEFLLLDNGHAIIMAYELIPFDFSPYGGPENGTLIDIRLQEQDENKYVVFEWIASEHLPIEDTEVNLDINGPVDFLHTNGIAVDTDGNWLVSHRNFSEITKIDRQTGDIIWRMGGASNEFTFTNDTGFWNQHNINRLPNGNITLFDNGTFHTPPHSRAIEYMVDENAKTVTRVWMYPQGTTEYSSVMSNVQRLPNTNSMIGWGNRPKLTEVLYDGTVALEMALGTINYRAFRFPWNGVPADPPRGALFYDADPTAVTIYTSWNGATDITDYEIYGGPTTAAMSLIDTAPRTGFETEISLTGLSPDSCFFRTKPVHDQGNSTPVSNLMFRSDLYVCWDQLEHSYMPLSAKA